ncbi:response regulator [Nostoc linckia FACHB-104]|nr:response regulator [Nostoc linckia FACHB-104]
MQSLDWSITPVGAVETWPQSLKTAVRIMLGSRYPMFVWWGESMTNFYNDAYIPVLGQRHPQALGQPASQVWAEIWETLGPQAEAVLQQGHSSWNEELLLVMQRNGYTEETYFTFSYSPILQDDGTIGGVFCACSEETRRVVGDRRLRSLRELAANTAEAKTVADACEISAQTLDNNPYDVPFALLYLLDEKATQAQLVGTTRLAPGTTASPPLIDINADSQICDRWLLPAVLADGKSQVVDLEKSGFADLPGGAWPESPTTAIVLPLTTPTQERLSGFLIAGISPRRQFDDDYQGFWDLVAEYFENQVNLLVKDTGIGIPNEELSNLFKRFHRIKGSQGRSFEGSGIGLSLVWEIVELHHGKVSVTSVLGGGSCFTVTIPTGCDHLPTESLRASRPSPSTALGATPYVEEARRWLMQEAGEQESRGDKGDVDAKRLPDSVEDVITYLSVDKTARILLADDNADMRDYLKRFLSDYYQVETVGDGNAALNAVRKNPPDLVLTDVMMPQMDGFELLRSLRSDPQTQDIPIILLSARAGEESRIEGLAAGADDYIVKPFSARELLARVEASLKLSQLRQGAQLREQSLRMQAEAALSDRQKIEASLRESEERFRQMAETIESVFWLSDVTEKKLLYVSPAYEQVWGRSCESVYQDLGSWIETIHPEDRDLVLKATEKCITNYNHTEEYRIILPDGTIRWIRDRGFLVQDGEGKPYRIAGVADDISERKQVEQEREQLLLRERATREEAERANRIKDDFLAVLSHELRSPLNPILGWSKLLQNGKLSPSATAGALATIERNAKLQVQLIDDLLDISRILRGKLVLNAIPVDLCSIISSALETVRLAAEAKSLEIHTNITPKVSVIGDATRLQQVVWNMLSNAVKFTPSGGKIEVGLTCVGTNAQIQVRDTGKGISAEFLPYVFEHFQQEDGSTTRQFGGLGLGLAIVRQLVELHGGTVAVDSPGEGQGATFTVYIPLATNVLPTPALPALEQQTVNLEGINILVVDDEPDSREFLSFVLTQQQATVTTVASGAEALKVLAAAAPDLLISDIGMPEMDGYMLMQTIRTSQPDKFLPAIALTAYAGELNQQKAIAAGFHRHIVKPIDPNTVVAIAIELVQQKIITRR